jgi:hypothetical protein
MRRMGWLRGLKFALFAALAVAVVGAVVMALWNTLLPVLFGWPAVGFWQALGLLLLSKILFGSLRAGRGGGRHWRVRMADRWEKMSDDERARFRAGMGRGCGRGSSPMPPPETT